MKRLLFVLLLAASFPYAAFAQSTQSNAVVLDQVYGVYRVVAQVSPYPVVIGRATLRITITNAQTGEPLPVSGVIVLPSASSVGQQTIVIAPAERSNPAGGVYITQRLNFPISDTWNIVYRISTPQGSFDLKGDIEVASVYGGIARAAVIAVPATLVAIGAALLGYRVWRKKRTVAS